jgi:hypothetical protein
MKTILISLTILIILSLLTVSVLTTDIYICIGSILLVIFTLCNYLYVVVKCKWIYYKWLNKY